MAPKAGVVGETEDETSRSIFYNFRKIDYHNTCHIMIPCGIFWKSKHLNILRIVRVPTNPSTRLTIRPGFPVHVLFFGPCPGVRAAFQKCPGFSQFVPDRLTDRCLITYLSVL